MKQFKFIEQVFTHFFPSYYKENDTYKDADGRGILERFVNICSEYFDEEVVPEIGNFLDILDVDKTPEIYLNYLWEYFSYLPYAYGVITNGEPYSKENLKKWLARPRQYPITDYRGILKYAISLYKIRGTADFYTILGRFYGVHFELEDLGNNIPKYNIVYDDSDIKYDTEYTYDQKADCLECIEMKVKVYIPKGIIEYLTEHGTLNSGKLALVNLLNKFVPIHVNIFTTENVEFYEWVPNVNLSSCMCRI